MKDIKLKCILLSSGPSRYTILMIILSPWYFVFMKTMYLIIKQNKNAPNRFDQVYIHYLHYGVCQISMSDLIMNVHKCVTHGTTYTMLYVRLVCLT